LSKLIFFFLFFLIFVLLIISTSYVSLLLFLLLLLTWLLSLLLLLTVIVVALSHLVLNGTFKSDTGDTRRLLWPRRFLLQIHVELDGISVDNLLFSGARV